MVNSAAELSDHRSQLEQASNTLQQGYRSLEAHQLRDAWQHFNNAISLNPADKQAILAHNQAIQRIVPRWHFTMMNDRLRNNSFDSAISNVVTSCSTVLDVGTGSGLLALMAARAGAKRVYTCELEEIIADYAKMIVALNGYADKIKVINKKSSDLVLGRDLPEPVDVLVTETVDSALLGEGIIPIINDVKQRLLKPGGKIIPSHAHMYAALIESRPLWEMNHVDRTHGFDLSLFNDLSTNGFYPVRLQLVEHKFLTDVFPLCQFDFQNDTLTAHRFDIRLPIVQSGHCHAVAYWFDLYLDEQTCFTSAPGNSDLHWKQAIQCFRTPVALTAKKPYRLAVTQELTRFDFTIAQD